MMLQRKILIVAGGTGGHVFPALSVAEKLQEKAVKVHWIGTRRGIESKVISAAEIPIHFVLAYGFQGKSFLLKLRSLFCALIGVVQSLVVILRYKPDLVLAMGGFVSVPAGIAARLLGKPLVLHEQNSVLGLANRVLSKFASKILTGFPVTVGCQKPYQYVGNPVRKAIDNVPPPSKRFENRTGALRVLIFGGSQGAAVFNRLLPEWFSNLSKNLALDIRHQTGVRFLESVKARYETLKFPARVDAFIEDMASAYAWADIVISRSGASTVAELSAAGVPAILIPYAHSDNQQVLNAEFLTKAGAAILLPENDLSYEKFRTIFNACIEGYIPTAKGFSTRRRGVSRRNVCEIREDGERQRQQSRKSIREGYRENLVQMACRARAMKKEDAAARIVNELGF